MCFDLSWGRGCEHCGSAKNLFSIYRCKLRAALFHGSCIHSSPRTRKVGDSRRCVCGMLPGSVGAILQDYRHKHQTSHPLPEVAITGIPVVHFFRRCLSRTFAVACCVFHPAVSNAYLVSWTCCLCTGNPSQITIVRCTHLIVS